ncbi:MAG TPA: (2Fe-2S)-binding protein [Candidatus Binatia bacterium]|nr:(2Fe-2S)-binding protein [Candidatus Binatia bacterium]
MSQASLLTVGQQIDNEFQNRILIMIVCHCAAVTDRTIERLIGEGASSVAEIVRRCGAGRRCPPCRDEIATMLYAAGVVTDNLPDDPRARPAA